MKKIIQPLLFCFIALLIFSAGAVTAFELSTYAASPTSQSAADVADPQLQSLLQGINQNKQQANTQQTTTATQAQNEAMQKAVENINHKVATLGNWATATMILMILTALLFWIFLIMAILAIARWLSSAKHSPALQPQPRTTRIV